MRPLTWFDQTNQYGHFSTFQKSGSVTAMGAGEEFASIRWTSSGAYLVLMRCRVGIAIVSAVTTTTIMDVSATIVRGFTVDFTTASTAANMAAVQKTNRLRTDNMAQSLMGTAGPRISTTVIMTGATYTADANPFAGVILPMRVPTNATGTVVTLGAGDATPMTTVYEWTAQGQHPVVLGSNEGILLRAVTAMPGSGTWSYYTEWTWAEVPMSAI